MTEGQRMIWAITFALNVHQSLGYAHMAARFDGGADAWHMREASAAARAAARAVALASDCMMEVLGTDGATSDAYTMLRDMRS